MLSKQAEETITETGHEELMRLAPQAKAKTVERMKHLIELARLRQTTVDEAMERLGIEPPPVIHG